MSKRVNPTLNSFQERILVAKSHMNSTEPATLIKEAVGQMILRMSVAEIKIYQKHYDGMTEEEKRHTSK